jgi:hypothetical protein
MIVFLKESVSMYSTITRNKFIVLGIVFLTFSTSFCEQNFVDTLCFTIMLNNDSNSILGCGKSDDMRSVLSGPVIMENNNLLFHSCNGYVLYSQTGSLVDSHSVFKENRKLSSTDPGRLALAFPLDAKTLLYYRRNHRNGDSLELYEKKVFKKSLLRVNGSAYSNFKDIESSQLFNLAQNGFTDELAPKSFIKPNLVGYTSLTSGKNWWSLDKFYSFLSPVIVMEEKGFCSFFTGMLSDQKIEIQKHLITPLGVFCRDDRWFYYGIHSATGSTTPECHQKLYLCDNAGNLLSTIDFLKQVIVDDILVYDKKRNTNFTVKRPWQFVFSPAIDNNGDAYFGMIDFKAKNIEVSKRRFYHYNARIIEASPECEDIITTQKKFIILPGLLKFQNASIDGYSQTGFLVRNEQGKHRRATIGDISCKKFSVSAQRNANQEVTRKLMQGAGSLPPIVKHVRDSLSKLQSAQRPCTITLRYDERDKVREFYFSPCEDVIVARVLNVTAQGQIFIRVDLKDKAEVIVFSQDGVYLNRFTFNRQDAKKRKDVIAVRNDGTILEEDYERIKEDYTYFRWELKTFPPDNCLVTNPAEPDKKL